MKARTEAAPLAAADHDAREHAAVMRDLRGRAARNRAMIDAAWAALEAPPRTINAHLATLSPERRAELNELWEQGERPAPAT